MVDTLVHEVPTPEVGQPPVCKSCGGTKDVGPCEYQPNMDEDIEVHLLCPSCHRVWPRADLLLMIKILRRVVREEIASVPMGHPYR